MPIYQSQGGETDAAATLANEARARITELADAMFLAYANLTNYLTNNTQGATEKQIRAALGDDAADFDYLCAAMKRFLIRSHPDMKGRLAALTPPKTKTVPR